MRRGVWLAVVGVLAAAFGVASARAAGSETTTTGTTSTTTTTTTPSYAPLASSSLPAGCVGAGAGALVLPAHPVIALGTPASGLGPSAYPSSGSVLAFNSSTAGGATCKAGRITLSSVSLFGGVVTASSVQATDGKGTVAGLEIDGASVAATAWTTIPVDDWGQLTLGATFGRVTAPLVLRLLQAHDSLPAGTVVVVAFGASARPVAKPKTTQHQQAAAQQKHLTGAAKPKKSSGGKHHSKHSRRQASKRTLNFPDSSYPFLAGGRLAPGTKHNGVVSLAMHYLGIPYLWGGASPKTGFDCSGLVKYVFAKFGVYLPHYAASQFRAPGSVWVPPDRLQPGDLVFFVGSDGTRKAPGHVGIYVDDGYIIDAPHTGAFVRIDKLNERGLADGYVGAKRIVGAASLVARHLAHATKDASSVHVLPLMLAPQVTGRPSAASLPLIATDSTAERTSPPRNYGLWTGAVLGGVILLVAAAGAVTYRRRERAPQP